MATLLTLSERDQFHTLERSWLGTVVRQFGKRKLKVEGVISVMPHCRFVPLPHDVLVLDQDDRWLSPSPSKKFFITSNTNGPHIIIEAEDLPLLSTGS